MWYKLGLIMSNLHVRTVLHLIGNAEQTPHGMRGLERAWEGMGGHERDGRVCGVYRCQGGTWAEPVLLGELCTIVVKTEAYWIALVLRGTLTLNSLE